MTYRTKTKLCFVGGGATALLALYCFAGALMNGSFAVAGPVDVGRFRRHAAMFFWISVTFASLAFSFFTWGFVRHCRKPRTGEMAAAQQAVDADGRRSS